jgi:hypothetical protein
MNIEHSAVFQPSKNQVFCDVAGEIVLLNVTSGQYFGLDGPAVEVWQLLQNSRTVAEIITCMLEKYRVDPATCEADVCELLGEMARMGLVERVEVSTP